MKDMTERLEAISVQQTSSQSNKKSQAYQAAQKTPTATERMKKRASSNLKDSLERVEVSLSQWFTIDTYRLLRGDEYVRQVLVENECTLENVLAGATTNSQVFSSIFSTQKKLIFSPSRRVELERAMACVVVASRREKNRAYFFDCRWRYCRFKLVPICFQSIKHQWVCQI